MGLGYHQTWGEVMRSDPGKASKKEKKIKKAALAAAKATQHDRWRPMATLALKKHMRNGANRLVGWIQSPAGSLGATAEPPVGPAHSLS